ncbi:nardilysin [Mycetomoellerius zeteki]|nr:PREDICTED: nardilysin-like [Trachymyrmex zeteki]
MPVVKSWDKIQQVEYLDPPIKSENDKREYRSLRLPNGLEALLISDGYLTTSSSKDKKQEKKAACSLCVNVGYFSDPPEFPGISHFLSYMLFQEPEKSSKQTNLENFILDCDGTNCVLVDHEYTTFYFDTQENNLFITLHNFSHFFANSIMLKRTFMEKADTIKSEFQKDLFIGKMKYQQLFNSFAQIGHPANKFPVDHLINLRNNIDYDKLYDVLDKYKYRHYSANRMKLAIRSGLPLNTMEKFVTACFGNIPNNRMSPDNFFKFKNDLPFDTPAFRKMYKVDDDAELLTRLEITWALPSLPDFYKCNSYQYILWIIGYEGKGSLISYLRKKMWSPTSDNNMFCCNSQQNSLYSLIQLTITLTSEGRKHLENVLNAIFSFIDLLKTAGPQKEIYDDIFKSKTNIFRFTDYDKEPISFVKQLSKNMHLNPPNAYICGNQLNPNYDSKVIQKCLNYLAPEMANIMIFSDDFYGFELNKVEPWWQTAYTDIEISKEWIEYWKAIKPLPDFSLPSPNIFLTDNLLLIPLPKEIPKYPIKLYSNPVSEIWYRPDPKFRLPRCYMYFHFISPLKLQSLKNGVLMDMYCRLFKQLLVEELYAAVKAGFKYDINVSNTGFILQISGYNETLPHITFKNFQDFVKSFTECLYIQCLVQGNITPIAAIKIIEQFIKTMNCSPLHPNTIQQLRGTQIPLGTSYYKIKNINKLDTTSMITNYYQAGVTTIELSTLIRLLVFIMDDKLHEGLPIERFIYNVIDFRDINGVLGYSITVCTQADKYATEYVDKKIDEFLRWFKYNLKKFTEEELNLYKEMFLKSRLRDDVTLEDEVNRNWKAIVKRTYIFDLYEQEILALEKINVNKLREWFADHTSNGSNFRKLSIHVVGTIPKKANYIGLEYINNDHQQNKQIKNHHITKVENYKKKLFMFPTKGSNNPLRAQNK